MRFRRRTISSDVSLNSLAYEAGIKIKPFERDPVILVFIPRCGDAVPQFHTADVAITALTPLSMFGAFPRRSTVTISICSSCAFEFRD